MCFNYCQLACQSIEFDVNWYSVGLMDFNEIQDNQITFRDEKNVFPFNFAFNVFVLVLFIHHSNLDMCQVDKSQ